MLLLGLGHKARHGKDTFADAARGAFPDLDIRLHSFADPLRKEVRAGARQIWAEKYPSDSFHPQQALELLCNHHGVEFDPNAKPDQDYPWGKQRVLHQWWGTEYRRAQDPQYWVKQGKALIDKAKAAGADAVIFRDMRFYNEYDMIGELGGYRVKISRLGWLSDVPVHVSETQLDDRPFDLHLGIGDGNLQLLQDLSVLVFRRLLQGKVPTFLCA